MSLASGTKLGPYEIQSPLGAGGMGEVYRARDSRLGRDVALKILPESFARDSDRLHRFEQETQAVAALNHPNILAIHDVGQHNGVPFLVSELLEGETLRAALDEGVLPQRKAIEYGVQIAQGLAAAHDKGIVHRDLKPENLFVTKDGRVKILDFGLAKLAAKSDGSPNSDGVTLTSHTAVGTVMGTASYMAPEQVRGEMVDARTDIFAFGAVLFEMLSGQRAFRRDTPAETMTAVLKEDPPELATAQTPISPALDRIVRRCLEKSPEQRFQSAKDLSFALSALSGSNTTSTFSAIRVQRRISPWTLVAVALALLAGAAAAWFVLNRPVAAERLQFAIPVPGEVSHMALSPDGSMLAFVSPDDKSGVPMLFVQRVGSPAATELQGTEGASYPFWSPDDANVGFFAGGKLNKIPAAGGTRQVLATAARARGGSWSRTGVIIYAPDAGGPIWRINADGSNAAPATGAFFRTEGSHRWPLFLPDGDRFLFWSGNFANVRDDDISGIYMSSLEAKDKKLIVLTQSNPGYAAGYLFYLDDKRELSAKPLDLAGEKVAGEARVIAEQVGFQPSTFRGAFTVAENGTLVSSPSSGATLSALTWYDRGGKELGRVGEVGVMANPTLSPDGNHVAVDITDVKANNVDIWIHDLERGTASRFTFDPSEEVAGTWSRDGSVVAYRSVAGGTALFLKNAQGLEAPKAISRIIESDDVIPNSWSLDDKQILCTLQPSDGNSNLGLVAVSGGSPTPFLVTKASETNGQISPDGKWVAYASNESGDWEIYVTNFPGAAGKWQVSRGGGNEPRWRGDSKEIFYIAPTGVLMAVPVETEGTFSTRTPVPLFQIHGRAAISSTDLFTYDAAKDGKRFLVNRYVKPDQVAPLTVVLHATAEAQR